MKHVRITLALVLGALVFAPVGAQEKRGRTFVDALEQSVLGDPQLSPDGKQILFTIEKADWKANRRVGHIYRINADGTGQVQLTFGERGENSPRWSPDGKQIAFTTRRDPDANNQIYLLNVDGGEARRLTNHPTAPGSLTWAPDGKSIYFVAADDKTADEKEKDRVRDDVYAFEESNFKQRHLWTTDLEGKTKRITEGDWNVSGYELSADGKRIAMQRMPSPLLEFMDRTEVWLMDATGANATQLTKNMVPESNASLSPDGSTVLFTSAANEQFEIYYNDKIFLVPAAGGAAKVLLPDVSYEVENAAWSKDGKSIYFTANMGVHNEIMKVDVATRQVTQITKGDHNLGSWSFNEDAGLHVFTRNSAERPSEVHLLAAAAGAQLKRVTAVFDEELAKFKTARQEKITWKGQDGVTIEGLLTYPLDYKAGTRYPLIVQTHGGPAASDRFGFSTDNQVYAAKGYAVLRPNYRGSTGYGDVFLRDMVKGYFKQSHLDVMLGADAVIAMGIADPAKLIKMGWSAGGHMTNKIVTFTDRFKAASSGAGAANWISMYAQSDHREFRTPWFGGSPWQANAPIDLFWDHSPLKDAAKVKTPTIFLVGEQDPRVPLPQSVEMFRALKSNGVPTHLYVAPREGHGWTELRHRLFKLQIEMEWFEKHVHNRSYTWERVPGEEKKETPKPTTTAGQQ
ncbi:MAG TPA: S9 family peptidase [Vicinamibacterales bacterium]|nr:S9 family peptidase [Vicinamibacterales bacterium]